MLALAHSYLADKRVGNSLLNFLLPRLIADLQGDFCRFADCGAGIGTSTIPYAETLKGHLKHDLQKSAVIACYEPLPENFVQLTKNLAGIDMVHLHMEAVSDVKGTADFFVPLRMAGGHSSWSEGTSYAGSLSPSDNEKITVNVVRLEDSYSEPFDFVKLDLQGGEMKALHGLGATIDDVKLMYVETQLFGGGGSTDFLNRKGFITFFDELQFQFRPDIAEIPHRLLAELGIELTRTILPSSSSPMVCWGRFLPHADLFDADTLAFKASVVATLRSAGFEYVQTDTLAVNPSIFPVVFRHLLDPARQPSQQAPAKISPPPRRGRRRYWIAGPRKAH